LLPLCPMEKMLVKKKKIKKNVNNFGDDSYYIRR
jgi:hypothetical protein